MKTLILGASGATGSLAALELLKREVPIRIFVREGATLPAALYTNPLVEIIRGNISEISVSQLSELLDTCDSVISCLGHTISFKGMFGHPRNLVSDAIRNIGAAIHHRGSPTVKLILMSTTAYASPDDSWNYSFGDRLILSIMQFILPPHNDNINAARCLQKEIGAEDPALEWIAVRPDTLINEPDAGPYEIHPSPVRSPVFNAGTVARLNVGRFMADLLTSEPLWRQWRYRMPVIYNKL